MKTEKIDHKYWFYYKNSKTNRYHRLYNDSNQWIGYYYQDRKKGFALNKYKIK
jgi:hypothetical protein